MAAYPTSYEFPYCPECKTLSDAVVSAQDYVLPTARPKQISFKVAEGLPKRDV
jgi:hypothetical protein